MLYLPPGWRTTASPKGECMTCSIGFRSAGADELARELLQRSLDGDEARTTRIYRDPKQGATTTPGLIPAALQEFGRDSLARWLRSQGGFEVALGEVLSEPKPGVWFDRGAALARATPGCASTGARA